jgi:hypothetical protein
MVDATLVGSDGSPIVSPEAGTADSAAASDKVPAPVMDVIPVDGNDSLAIGADSSIGTTKVPVMDVLSSDRPKGDSLPETGSSDTKKPLVMDVLSDGNKVDGAHAADTAGATAISVKAADNLGSWMVGGLDRRVLLMSQDMAGFGVTSSGGSERTRWRGDDARPVEYFAA